MDSGHDVLIVIDATASMDEYLDALNTSIPEIMALSKLSGAFQRLGVIAYRDYSEDEVISASGWDHPNLAQFAASLKPIGGGDYPEAAKTGLITALRQIDPNRKTLILWYTDAPPHHQSRPSPNQATERDAFPPRSATDWVKLSYEAAKNNCTVLSFISGMDDPSASFYVFLSKVTRGVCIDCRTKTSAAISRLTLDVLLSCMGNPPVTETGTKSTVHEALMLRFDVPSNTPKRPPTDEDADSKGYLPQSVKTKVMYPIARVPFDLSLVPVRVATDRIEDPAKRYSDLSEHTYRLVVAENLELLMKSNVCCLSWNPIFGKLWRVLCKEYTNPTRDKLVKLFSTEVSKIKEQAKRDEMRAWLEQSYDATEQIEDIIASAPDAELWKQGKQKRVYLDLDALGPGGVNLSRMELLEVSRSCYAGILQKLATILTHLKIVEPEVVLAPRQRSIPLSLPPEKLFSTIPHLVVPGTLFSDRASAIVAVLTLIIGVPFLVDPASTLITQRKGKWLDVEIPENISFDCARLLLRSPGDITLTNDERRIYEDMKVYRLIELNLDSSLVARVPWSPDKTRGVGDHKVECTKCKIMRSVTLMSTEKVGWCGHCADGDIDPKQYPDKGEVESCWVECASRNCRALYVVENIAGLNVRPRCWYCRQRKPCPWQECTQCQNRIIIPKWYRPHAKDYLCPACDPAVISTAPTFRSIVDKPTTAKTLSTQNTLKWLRYQPNPDLFQSKSAFKLFVAHGASFFARNPPLLPKQLEEMRLDGKQLHDIVRLISQVEERVGKGEIELGTCTLCFNDFPHNKLVSACGRSGCQAQPVDESCLERWYGANKPGKLLSPMQLLCPFCRRLPTVKIITRYNRQAAALGGLQAAVDDKKWYYGWCSHCGFAKRSIERACCDSDRLPEPEDFTCEECTTEMEAERVRLVREAEEALRLAEEAEREEARQMAEEAEREEARQIAEEVRRERLSASRTRHPQLNLNARARVELAREQLKVIMSIKKPLQKITMCPRCKVLVEKTAGCNHISCICGAHFCHCCGEEMTESGLMTYHARQRHGGYFG